MSKSSTTPTPSAWTLMAHPNKLRRASHGHPKPIQLNKYFIQIEIVYEIIRIITSIVLLSLLVI